MTLKYSILGLLATRPMSGYDLKGTFDQSVSYVWNASGSQIYSALRDLERNGLVQAELIVQESRPNKKIYSVTPPGQQALRDWLKAPVPEKFSKDEFLVKLFFGNEVDDTVALQHLVQFREHLQEQADFLEQVRGRLLVSAGARNARARRFRRLSLEIKLASIRCAIAEAERVEHELSAPPMGVFSG